MSNLLIRNLDERVLGSLRARAARNGRSIQQELRAIVHDAVDEEVRRASRRAYYERAKAFNDRLAAAGRRLGDSTFDIRRDRDSDHWRY